MWISSLLSVGNTVKKKNDSEVKEDFERRKEIQIIGSKKLTGVTLI